MALNNATILDAIRLSGSNDYQQRVPQATQSGVDSVVQTLTSPNNRSLFNDFQDGLINRIAQTIVRSWEWANPLAVFKRPMLNLGDKIQEIAVGLIEANGYDLKDNNLFKTNPGEVWQAFHSVNREDRYDLSISHVELRKAFTTEFGLNELVARKLASLAISDEYDEFRIMIQLIAVAYAEDTLFKVKTPFANADAPTDAELRNLSIAIRTYAKKMSIAPSSRYNAKGVPTVSNKDNLVLITTPGVTAALDVSVLADAFNIDRADFASKVIEIDEFPMAGVHAMLVDTSWFVCADYVKEIATFWNPKNMVNNYYLHHWGTYSISPFSNAVLFGEDEATEVGVVNVAPTALAADVVDLNGDSVDSYSYGDDLKLVVTATANVSPKHKSVIAPDAYKVEVTIVDADDEAIDTTMNTSISFTGNVRVQENLPVGSKITIKATSTYVNPSSDGKKPEAPKTAVKVLTVA